MNPEGSREPIPVAEQPERNESKGKLFLLIGMSLFLLGSLSLLLLQYGSVFNLPRPDNHLAFYVIGLSSAALGIRLAVRGKKLRTRDVADLIRLKESNPGDTRPTFLYLRSFILDEADGKESIPMPFGLSAPLNPWESGLSSAFGKVGDLVAIGRPGEKLATIGAARLYVTEEEWQDRVIELIGKAELVIWT